MDLFVVQRFEGDHEITQEEEKTKLEQLLQKIESKKKQRKKQKPDVEIGKVENSTHNKQLTEEVQAQLEPQVDSNINEFNDEYSKEDINDSNSKSESDIAPKHKRKKRKIDLPDNVEGFTVLGAETSGVKKKVKRVLPKWLAEPTIISTNLSNLHIKVSNMKSLDKDLRKKLKLNGVKYLFPVQAEVIPWLLDANNHSSVVFPNDICVSAPTGSGKTLAFVLPVIQSLKQYLVKKIRALVLLPTQDLALQVFKTFKLYCEGTNVDVCFITGNNSFSTEQKLLVSENEAFGYITKADIIICTAGRLVDHLKHTRGFDLTDLEFLVIDEADRVLDTVQHDWLYHLENHLRQEDPEKQAMGIVNLFNLQKKRPPQKLLFSATLSQDPEKLQKLSLFQPKLFTSVVEEDGTENGEVVDTDQNISNTFIGKYTTPKELSEKYVVCSLEIKPLVLYKYIKTHSLTRTLVFTNSIIDAHRLCILLRRLFKDELKVEELSSHSEIKSRKELISEVSKGNINIIICTDTLARGIDLPEIQCVVSYSAPKHLKTYIHRAGRTARAGLSGTAVTLLQKSQVSQFQSMLQHADKKNVEEVEVPTDDLESFAETYGEALEELKRAVHKEEEDDLYKIRKTKQAKRKKNRKEKNDFK